MRDRSSGALHATRPPSRRRRGRRKVAPTLIVVAIVLVALLLGAWYVLFRAENPVDAGRSVEVTIKSGSSTAAIADVLAKAGVVDNASMFRLRARLSKSDGALKPGEYAFSTGMPYDRVIAKLESGPDIVYYSVPIPEGFTARQVAARFTKRANIPEDELLSLVTSGAPEFEADHPYLAKAHGGSLEGFLFPATYRVKQGTSAHDVVEMMLDQFDARTAALDLDHATAKNLDLTDVVIIASILERETKLAKEYPLVASVIYNRLAKPMRLQLDSTVFYGLAVGTTTLTKADLQNSDPHNTYSHDGLSAGPISNPGMAAIEAAAAPATTNYYYYVLTGKDGSQTFTTTYADFLVAVKKYHEVFDK